MKYYFLAIVLLALGCSRTSPANQTKPNAFVLQKTNWVLGTWEISTKKGSSFEIWTRSNDSLYLGISYYVIGQDTVSSESIQLEQKGGDVYYVPTVSNQNGGQAVRFKMTKQEVDLMVFENPEHDFPQKITYSKISTDSMVAEISGNNERMIFQMKKLK